MCYFLYGGMNKEVDLEDFNKIEDHYFNFKIATPDQIKKSIARKDYKFSIGNDYCECDTPIGSGEVNSEELQKIIDYIHKLCKVKGMKYIFISKNWYGDKTKKEETVHIKDIDLASYLANMEENCLYKIQLFKRYY